ncbi:hypothetical protein VTP01DRAFT_3510 [Rhizomucor pusillus]|uniref:uncharacterized protein n=1 Tax=Rhizomucor pusillus TaxID=4840 RepID=UPI0037422558
MFKRAALKGEVSEKETDKSARDTRCRGLLVLTNKNATLSTITIGVLTPTATTNSNTITAATTKRNVVKTTPPTPPSKPTSAKTAAAKKLPAKGNKRTAPSARRRLPTKTQVVRALQDAAASPSGYEFVYLPCRHHLKFQDVRKMLSSLKVQQSRVLDVQFPAKDTVALLAHSAFKAELVAKLAAEGVQECGAFDPLSPVVLADPKFTNETTIVRRLFTERMRRTCVRLPRHIGARVARHFGTAHHLTTLSWRRMVARVRRHLPPGQEGRAHHQQHHCPSQHRHLHEKPSKNIKKLTN